MDTLNAEMAIEIPVEAMQLLSSDLAWHYRVLPKSVGDQIELYCDEGLEQVKTKEELSMILGQTVVLIPVQSTAIQQGLSKYYRKSAQSSLKTVSANDGDFMDQLFREAVRVDASDIHIEPYEFQCRVRLRIDGKLVESFVIPSAEYPSFVNKLKIKANLDIAEKRMPQDGRIVLNLQGTRNDVRVSVLPTLHGEKVVMRLLKKDATDIDIDKLGMTDIQKSQYLQGIRKPNGIILISGPTGSGKTTTLYATLKELNQPDTNISTVEDPIEYTLDGINQVQVKESIGLSFSAALRSFLRQDPDVIMLGEIRDGETAEMAIRAALTGHLVLSTIHTNSAWGTVSRLVDMGVPAYLLSGTLNMTLAQRLIRKLCPVCKTPHEIASDELPHGLMLKPSSQTFKAEGCEECYYTGYKGRRALYEIIPIDPTLSAHIRNGKFDVASYLEEQGIMSLSEQAINALQNGETSLDEVYPLLLQGI